MIKNLLKVSLIFTIILGSFLVSLHFLGVGGLTIVSSQTKYIAGWQWKYYTIDLHLYIKNLQNSLNALTLPQIIPNQPQIPTWPNLTWNDLTQLVENIKMVLIMISKYILTGINYIVYVLNLLLLTPLKLLLYPVRIIYTLIGLNTTSEDFIKAIEIVSAINIPYIPINY